MELNNDRFLPVPIPKYVEYPNKYLIKLEAGKSVTVRYVGETPLRFRNIDRTRTGFHFGVVVDKGEKAPGWAIGFVIERMDKVFSIGDIVECDYASSTVHTVGAIANIGKKTITIKFSLYKDRKRRLSHYDFCEMNYTFDLERYNRNHDDHHGRYLHPPEKA